MPRGWLSYLGKRWKKISFEVPFFSEEEVTSELGRPFWTLIERFLLVQGDDGKEHIIDDYRRSHVNAASALRSYLELQNVANGPTTSASPCLLDLLQVSAVSTKRGTFCNGSSHHGGNTWIQLTEVS